MMYGGGGHIVAVIAAKVAQGKPYDFRFASLVTNGAILFASGITHVVASRGIWRGNGSAIRSSAVAATAVIAYCAILMPVASARSAALPALALNLVYLVALGGMAWSLNNRNDRAR